MGWVSVQQMCDEEKASYSEVCVYESVNIIFV